MAGLSTACFYGKNKRSPTAVLIPQGDVSDIDLDDSDDDEENVAKRTTSTKLGCHEGSPSEIGLDVEIDDDEEDENTDSAMGDKSEKSAVPAQQAKKTGNKRTKTALNWRSGDMDAVQEDFCEEFGPPPDNSLSPYQYFKLFCDDSVFNNFAEQTNLYSVQNTGSSVNTNAKEMEQFVGIHVISEW
ncbi:hypothetical protein HPB50_024819 [Hyalomma asiaticum]|uniref:Uncharacterized protein n=1 Tax=Hyalomma asiaticum TaxID=266040 RepID=A0ACB7TNV5_HYAAI|nr:hypothetical protein HPB50_024819 [Hyalomma asiaticum]